MIGILIVTHGGLASAFKDALENLLGPQQQIEAIEFRPDSDSGSVSVRIGEAVNRINTGDGVAILTDMFGGTPTNLAIVQMKDPGIEVLSGINLPMLIQIVKDRQRLKLKEAIASAQQTARQYQTIATKVLGRAPSRKPRKRRAPVPAGFAQRPAAYRFGLRNGKIDALPDHLETLDGDTANDLWREVVTKARAFQERLHQTNSSQRVRHSVQRLLEALGQQVQAVRPGVLLSRTRSIEADRYAFGNDEGRKELFPDAMSLMDDLLLSLQDLLSVFPIVREIEAERLALSISEEGATIEEILNHASIIKQSAQGSEVVSSSAVAALKENDPEIEETKNQITRSRLVADQLLVIRNFASAVARLVDDFSTRATAASKSVVESTKTEIGEVASESWSEIKKNFPRGVGTASRIAPIILLIALLGQVSAPLAGIAAAVAGFKPLVKAIKKLAPDELDKRARKK